MAKAALQALAERLAGWQVAVIGDVILDEYLIGTASRLSREAPIPVLEFERREVIAGGAANPSANVAALGSFAHQIGVIGADENGATLRALLAARQIRTEGLIVDATRQTTTKTRIMAQIGLRFPQQVARLDRVDRTPIRSAVAAQIGAALTGNYAAIICSDYLNGLLTPEVVAQVRAQRALRVADAQGELDKYSGFDVVKCNADEAQRALRRELRTDADFGAAAHELRTQLQLRRGICLTRGADGITVADENGVQHVPAPQVEDVFDTVGAGDTVVAVVSLALLAGADLRTAAQLATFAASIVIRRVGNYAPTRAELLAEIAAHG
ncbi:MAG: ribokinase [Candidatus Thermofonsia Clade 1 bacterium]|jgi:rfaE bifunctional protein kinase chain/domain|uniref:Ribokinase n=1 Tax=Candidatus Thermofonsia Clade 1 bacterium TaxID=2364210 RepID=A0A2M8PIB2_9CHLR|nr:MAG: ribokinase [Candidatus Thermofonsia Clade 1 bacterium]RMF53815.1 MAG: ribokinase [Chloroflexota bacterium]